MIIIDSCKTVHYNDDKKRRRRRRGRTKEDQEKKDEYDFVIDHDDIDADVKQ